MSRPPRRPPPPRHTVAVEIAGEKHVLRSDVPPEYTRAVAAHVDATIRALPGFQTLEPFRAATLAALSITDELFRAREEIRRLRDEAGEHTGALADVLESAVAAAAEKRPVRRPAGAIPSASASPGGSPAAPSDAATPIPTPPLAIGLFAAAETAAPAEAAESASPSSPAAGSPATPPPLPPADASVRPAGDAAPAETRPIPTPVRPPAELPAWMEDAKPPPLPRPQRELGDDDETELQLPPPW